MKLAVSPVQHPASGLEHRSKGSFFWLSFIAIVTSIFLSALDLTAVATALPTITSDLNGGDEFSWVGSAYALSSTAFLPLSGALADVFGRKPVMMGSILLFAVGSALAGAAQTMTMLIIARTIQGLGGGGIINLAEIITSDLVPLAERGLYQGLIALTWSFASGIGPPIGGSLSEKASWRWLFYINIPLSGAAFCLVWIFLRVRKPEGSILHKMTKIDWIGNLIIIAGSALAIVGLTFGGIRFPWGSSQVLVPLVVGFSLIAAFFLYEARVPREPTIPWEVLGNRTSVGGFLGTLIHGVASISMIYFLPVYFQACLDATPIRSGIDMLGTAMIIAPSALLAGIIVQVTRKYRPVNIIGWMVTIIGFGLLSTLKAEDTTAKWVGYQIVASIGTGVIFASTFFPILAPLPVERTAAALAFFAFLRAFAQTWGIAISSAILQNELKKTLPSDFVSLFPDGVEIAYAAIPAIHTLDEPLKREVKAAFANSMSLIWKVMIGVAGLGLLSVALLKEIPMRRETDKRFGLDVPQQDVQGDPEGAENASEAEYKET